MKQKFLSIDLIFFKEVIRLASYRQRGKKWEYRIRYVDPACGKTKEISKGGFRTKSEAKLAASELEKQIYLGKHSLLENREKLIKDWFNEWLEVYGSQVQLRTLKNRKTYVNNQIIPYLGDFKLNQLPRLEYQKFINRLTENYSLGTVKAIHSIFCIAINKAVELEMLTYNKYRNISIKKEKDLSERKINYLTRDEVTIFMDTAKQCPFYQYIVAITLLRTGMRKGELIALHWDDINFKDKTISITKTRSSHGVKPPKTKRSMRTISIDDTLVTELKKYQTWQKRNKLKYGANYIEQEYMITQANGKALSEFRINDIMKAITNKAKLHHISPHGLRHTHAIMLLESGADIKFVSDRLGHTNIKMTADVYLHITKKYESENITKLDRYLSN